MAAKGPKGAKPTPNRVKAKPGRTPDSDLVPYDPPALLEDLSAIKHRIRKATYKGRDLNQLAKVFTVDALTVLVECVQDKQHNMSDRIRASELLLNRAWGKPKEHIEHSGDGVVIAAPDIMAIINARRAQVIDVIDVTDDG